MTEKMLKTKERFMQYSKKMASRVAIFWMIYRIANFAVLMLRPDISKYLVDLTTGIDTVMILNVGFYTGNSISEKGFIAFGKRKSLYNDNDDEKDEDNNNNEEQTNKDDADNG